MFNNEDILKNLEKVKSRDWLYSQYIVKDRSTEEIASDLKIDKSTVSKYLNIYNIKKDAYLSRKKKTREKLIEKSSLENVLKLENKEWLYNHYIILNKSQAKISKELGISSEIIKKQIKIFSLFKQTKISDISDKLTKEWLSEEYLNKNRTMLEICAELKIHQDTLIKHFRKYGIFKLFNKLSRDIQNKLDSKEWLYEEYINKNRTTYEISDALGIKRDTLHRYLSKHKIRKNASKINKNRIKNMNQTVKREYSVDNVSKLDWVQKKMQETNIKKYGGHSPTSCKKIHNKQKLTNLEKYGFYNPMQSQHIQEKSRQTNLKNRNVDWPAQDPEVIEKIYKSKKKNGTFSTSKPELEILEFLKSIYPNTAYQYKSKEYPFSCDYYIPSLALYIEFQGSWTHGEEPFNGFNLNPKWIKRASEGSKYYKNAIQVYTEKDPEKRKRASENNLNFLEIWYSDYKKGLGKVLSLIYKQGLPLKYQDKVLKNEYKKIQEKPGNFKESPIHNKIIEHFHPHFYKKERELWNNPIIREKLILNREKYKFKTINVLTIKQVLQGFKISGINKNAYSFFSPLWIKAFIEKYNIKSIYDPCAGWGHRMLGSSAINYIGNDLCEKTYKGLLDIKNHFKLNNSILYNESSEEFIPSEDIEAIFTCPPYFNKERYGGRDTSTSKYPKYSDWLNIWWRNTVKNSLKTNPKYFSFIINNKYKEDMRSVCIDEGLKILEEVPIGKNHLNHFQRTSNKSHKGENLLVFI